MNPSLYIQNLYEIIGKTEITDIEGRFFDFNTGIQFVIDLIRSLAKTGNKVIFIGNGGSAAIASHETIDFWKNGGIRAICFNEAALLTCIGNDYGYGHVFEKPIEMFADEGDLVVAISSSGESENILLGVEAARRMRSKTITFSGFSQTNPLRTKGDFNVYIPSGSYGTVEVAHQTLLHLILDLIMETKK